LTRLDHSATAGLTRTARVGHDTSLADDEKILEANGSGSVAEWPVTGLSGYAPDEEDRPQRKRR